MAEKKINYMARGFDDYRQELISLSQKYYPTLSNSFNDSSVGSWFIDLVSAVGDDLSYYIDRAYQETSIDGAMTRKNVMNIARTNGLKVPGKKGATCEVQLTCTLPVDSINISQPDWNYAPLLRRGTTVSNGTMSFEVVEDVNFGEQFNMNAYSNRTFTPIRNANGSVTSYSVSKTVLAVAGSTRLYTRVISMSELEPFMEVVLPETNVMNVESIIFKENANIQNAPETSEYYVDEEVYMVQGEAILTHRFFECDSLADQYRFGTATNIDYNLEVDKYYPELYYDFQESDEIGLGGVVRYYVGKWKPLTQKFITEYTDNGYLKIIFGSGVAYDKVPDYQSKYAERITSNMINNDMLGVLPEAGWTMFVLYKVGGGVSSNVAQGALNKITYHHLSFPSNAAVDSSIRNSVSNSLVVTNVSVGVAGKDEPSTAEIRNLIKYNTGAQDRCVTLKDYKVKVMQMPPKYGAPFRCNAVEENNKILIPVLNVNSSGNLSTYLPNTLVDNIIEWMSHYKTIGDYIEVKSGKIYNIGFLIDAFIDKNYDAPAVINSIINTVTAYMDINNHDMSEDIFLGDLEREINTLDGVIALIDLKVYNIIDGTYSSDVCPLPIYVEGTGCDSLIDNTFKVEGGAEARQINITETDHVLYGDYNAMYEVKYPSDIHCRVKQK